MLVVNKLGVAKIKKVRLDSERIVVEMVDGKKLVYRRVENESLQEVQIRRSS